MTKEQLIEKNKKDLLDAIENLPDYIDRTALLKDLEKTIRTTVKVGEPSAEQRGINKVVERIKCAPSDDDVVKVVRCRDCMMYDEGENEEESWTWCKLHDCTTFPYYFCSYALRKECS